MMMSWLILTPAPVKRLKNISFSPLLQNFAHTTPYSEPFHTALGAQPFVSRTQSSVWDVDAGIVAVVAGAVGVVVVPVWEVGCAGTAGIAAAVAGGT